MRISDWSSDVCSSYLHGGVGLLKTEITEYSGSGLEGNELPRSPAFTGSAGVLYRNGDGLTAALATRYTSSCPTEVTNPAGGAAGPSSEGRHAAQDGVRLCRPQWSPSAY